LIISKNGRIVADGSRAQIVAREVMREYRAI